MAGEVGLQSDVYLDGVAKPRTLHLKMLRRQWQIIALQVVATVALIGMYLEVVSTFPISKSPATHQTRVHCWSDRSARRSFDPVLVCGHVVLLRS